MRPFYLIFRAFKDSFGPNSELSFTVVNINIHSLCKYWDENLVDVLVLTEINITESSA